MEIDYTTGINFTFILFSLILGGMHGLEPGHGKTIVAAYLIGSNGSKLDAVILGVIVTLTHTSTVIVLAVLGQLISVRYNLTDEFIQKYIGLTGGILIFAVGLAMLIQRLQGKDLFHSHSHHRHSHNPTLNAGHGYTGEKQTDNRGQTLKISCWRMLLLGISGGIVPCPAAITILVYAGANGKLGAGLTYILLFSAGLAITLITVALLIISGSNITKNFFDTNRFTEKIAIGSASLITLIGFITIVDSVIIA